MMNLISRALAINELQDPIKGPQGILDLISAITNWFFAILLTVAVIFILLAAFTYLTSGGGENTAKAHKKLVYAGIAVAIAVLAKGIVIVAGALVGHPGITLP